MPDFLIAMEKYYQESILNFAFKQRKPPHNGSCNVGNTKSNVRL
jgi:hypothetical protein